MATSDLQVWRRGDVGSRYIAGVKAVVTVSRSQTAVRGVLWRGALWHGVLWRGVTR